MGCWNMYTIWGFCGWKKEVVWGYCNIDFLYFKVEYIYLYIIVFLLYELFKCIKVETPVVAELAEVQFLKEQLLKGLLRVTLCCSEVDLLDFAEAVMQKSSGIHMG